MALALAAGPVAGRRLLHHEMPGVMILRIDMLCAAPIRHARRWLQRLRKAATMALHGCAAGRAIVRRPGQAVGARIAPPAPTRPAPRDDGRRIDRAARHGRRDTAPGGTAGPVRAGRPDLLLAGPGVPRRTSFDPTDVGPDATVLGTPTRSDRGDRVRFRNDGSADGAGLADAAEGAAFADVGGRVFPGHGAGSGTRSASAAAQADPSGPDAAVPAATPHPAGIDRNGPPGATYGDAVLPGYAGDAVAASRTIDPLGLPRGCSAPDGAGRGGNAVAGEEEGFGRFVDVAGSAPGAGQASRSGITGRVRRTVAAPGDVASDALTGAGNGGIIRAPGPHRAPAVRTDPADRSATAGQASVIAVTDPDGDAVAWRASGRPSLPSLDTATRLLPAPVLGAGDRTTDVTAIDTAAGGSSTAFLLPVGTSASCGDNGEADSAAGRPKRCPMGVTAPSPARRSSRTIRRRFSTRRRCGWAIPMAPAS